MRTASLVAAALLAVGTDAGVPAFAAPAAPKVSLPSPTALPTPVLDPDHRHFIW